MRQRKVKVDIVKERRMREEELLKEVMGTLNPEEQRKLKLAGERGASSWVTVYPILEFGFALHKRHFIDAVCLRYGWELKDVPLKCACGSVFSVDHALSCLKGGFVNGRHNEIRDFTASLLTETCSEVAIEPSLQPVQDKDAFPPSTNTTDNGHGCKWILG